MSISRDRYKRSAYERGESAVALNVVICNHGNKTLNDLTLRIQPDILGSEPVKIASLIPNEKKKISVPVYPWLLPGNYSAVADLYSVAGKKEASARLSLIIAPQRRDFMPVILWGQADNKTVKSLGFTHQHVGLIPDQGQFLEGYQPLMNDRLDKLMASGLYAYSRVIALRRFIRPKRYLRKLKDGTYPPRPNVEASHPEVRKEYAQVVKETAQAIGDHPAWEMVLSNSEVRDASFLSYAHQEPENFKKFAGFPVPEHTRSRNYKTIDNFPWDQIISDQHKELVFQSWFWREGDGWNPLHELISDTLHKYIKRPNFVVFYDPATRTPAQWGSGGRIDAISQWTYTNPDPIKIGQATDEIIAMADGYPGQKVMSMTQAIWYRSRCAPANIQVKNPPEWLKREPKAVYISIPPDPLKIALWTKIARRLDGIMYHGSESLISSSPKHAYRYTNADSKIELQKLTRNIIQPLGPVLTKVPERMPEVAILESFASSIFAAQHFPLGWAQNWVAELHLALQWNQIQASILYDEHLLKGVKTDQLKVLFLPGVEVLTDKVLAKLQEMQKKGVILVGDEFTTPALMPDIRIKSVSRSVMDPAGSKKSLQKLGREISELLQQHYRSPMQATDQDLVLYRRGTAEADYIFVINDKRTFCDYIGQWKMVMAKGLPNSGTVSVNYPAEFAARAAAYDLIKHCEIPLQKQAGKVSFERDLAPADGSLVMVLKEPIKSVQLNVPEKLRLKDKFQLKVQLLNAAGKIIKAILPLEITLIDSSGKRLPGSGFYAAVNGELIVDEVIAPNTSKGTVTVAVKCLSSGKTATAKITIY